MIESCSTERMLVGVIFLGGLTFIVLFIENYWAESSDHGAPIRNLNATNAECWLRENFRIIQDCHPCSDFEIKSRINAACEATNYKELVECEKNGKAYRSCSKVGWIEERKFWKFEGTVFIIGVIFCIIVYLRQKVLDRQIMEGVYVSVSYIEGTSVFCDVDSAIILFVYRYLRLERNNCPSLSIVVDILNSGDVEINVSGFQYSLTTLDDLVENVKRCHLPVFHQPNECYTVAGLCGVLRQLIKTSDNARWLLGFREGGLSACAENSAWTKFCEVDLIAAAREYLRSPRTELPVDIVRFECHLSHPVRTHNVRKLSAKYASPNGLLEHCYAEGPEMFLSDLIIFPLVHFFFMVYSESVASLVPLTRRWYDLMLKNDNVLESLSAIKETSFARVEGDIKVPEVKNESLYKSNRKRSKASDTLFTKQEDVEYATSVIDKMGILKDYDYKDDVSGEMDWEKVPFYAQPKGGDLPEDRLIRKMQQIENITCAVLKIAEDGNTIVDFCSGSGHIGILVAHLLPRCHILLIDNKEHSLLRAVERIQKLGLKNVSVIQSNVDYFKGSFQIGVALHACGVASDLVIQMCISKRSKFIISPCCYGKLQTNHILKYPRSKRLNDSELTVRDYMVVGHSADQTHKELYEKSEQGEKCMKIIDIDRCIQAEECGYRVYLAKMKPNICTPKNNIIVGIPEETFKASYFE